VEEIDAAPQEELKDRCSVVGAQHAAPLLGNTVSDKAVLLCFLPCSKAAYEKSGLAGLTLSPNAALKNVSVCARLASKIWA